MPSFEDIFLKNRDLIHRYLLKLCRDEILAEELTQETFFKAYMNLAAVRDPQKIPIWLCRIAKNTYFAWYRQQKRTVPLETLGELPGVESPEGFWLRKELTQAALEALTTLEEPYKKVLILAIFGEMSLKAISELFGKSESWARVTFHRGKQKLLERIK